MSGASLDLGPCMVCEREPAVGVAAIPYIPMSVAYGRDCLNANAHPWWALTGKTACVLLSVDEVPRWREVCDPGWVQMVDDTCRHLGKTEAEFVREVVEAIADLDNGAITDIDDDAAP